MIGCGWRAKELSQNWFQTIRPSLIPFHRRVKVVDRHSFEEFAFRVGQTCVDIEESKIGPRHQLGEILIHSVDRLDESHIVVSGKDGGQDDFCLWCLLVAQIDDRPNAPCNFVDGLPRTNVVGSSENHKNLRIDILNLPVFKAPQNVLR